MCFNIHNLLFVDVGAPEFFSAHAKVAPKKRFLFDDEEEEEKPKKYTMPCEDSFFVKHFQAHAARKTQLTRPISPPPAKKLPPIMKDERPSSRPASQARKRRVAPKWERNEKELMIYKKYDPSQARVDITHFEPDGDGSIVNSPRSHDALRLTGVELYQLYFRPMESFREPGLLEERVRMRWQYYERKRKEKFQEVLEKREEIIAMEEKREELMKHKSEMSVFKTTNDMNIDTLLEQEMQRMNVVKKRSMEQVHNIIQREKKQAMLNEQAQKKEEARRREAEERERQKILRRKEIEEAKIEKEKERLAQEKKEMARAKALHERLRKESEERARKEVEKKALIMKKAEEREMARKRKRMRFEEMQREAVMIGDIQYKRRVEEMQEKEQKRIERLEREKERDREARQRDQEERSKKLQAALAAAAARVEEREYSILSKQEKAKQRQKERVRQKEHAIRDQRRKNAEKEVHRRQKIVEVQKIEQKRVAELVKRQEQVYKNLEKEQQRRAFQAELAKEKRSLLQSEKYDHVERQFKIQATERDHLLANIQEKMEKTHEIIEKKQRFMEQKRHFAQMARTDRDVLFGNRFYGLLEEMVVTKNYKGVESKLKQSSSMEKAKKKRHRGNKFRSKTAELERSKEGIDESERPQTVEEVLHEGRPEGSLGKPESSEGNGGPKAAGAEEAGEGEPKPFVPKMPKKSSGFNLGAALANFILGENEDK